MAHPEAMDKSQIRSHPSDIRSGLSMALPDPTSLQLSESLPLVCGAAQIPSFSASPYIFVRSVAPELLTVCLYGKSAQIPHFRLRTRSLVCNERESFFEDATLSRLGGVVRPDEGRGHVEKDGRGMDDVACSHQKYGQLCQLAFEYIK